ncbi:transcription elongation factor GreA [soil metagenome]
MSTSKRIPPPPEEVPPIPFTPDAYKALQVEFDRLTAERKEVMIRLQTAREMGDLSENGAYIYAKFELGSLNRQLSQTRHLLKYGVVIQKTNGNLVDFGCSVTVSAKGRQTTFLIVSMHESNLAEHKLSIESPIGSALLGKKVGGKVTVQVPNGEVTYTVIKIT